LLNAAMQRIWVEIAASQAVDANSSPIDDNLNFRRFSQSLASFSPALFLRGEGAAVADAPDK
jgi:hypothetical protein